MRSSGVRIRYEVEGDGPPLVLYPGFLGRLESWHVAGVVEALRADYRLILIDPRGRGASDKPHEPAAYRRDRLVADVITVLDDLGVERAHFWGYSCGGRVGFGLATAAADRLHALIVGGAHPYQPAADQAMVATVLRERGLAGFIADWEREHGALPVVIRARWLANDALALAAASEAWLAEPGLDEALPTLQAPTLIYCGDHDPANDQARQAAAIMANGTFVSLPGVDHLQVCQRGDLMAPRVRAFLEQAILAAQTLPRQRIG